MCRQVSFRLSAGPQAARASADMRSSGGLRQSISGALQRVSGIRSPSGATESGEPPMAIPMHKGAPHQPSVCCQPTLQEACSGPMLAKPLPGVMQHWCMTLHRKCV